MAVNQRWSGPGIAVPSSLARRQRWLQVSVCTRRTLHPFVLRSVLNNRADEGAAGLRRYNVRHLEYRETRMPRTQRRRSKIGRARHDSRIRYAIRDTVRPSETTERARERCDHRGQGRALAQQEMMGKSALLLNGNEINPLLMYPWACVTPRYSDPVLALFFMPFCLSLSASPLIIAHRCDYNRATTIDCQQIVSNRRDMLLQFFFVLSFACWLFVGLSLFLFFCFGSLVMESLFSAVSMHRAS